MFPSYLNEPYAYLYNKKSIGNWGRNINDFIDTDTTVQYLKNLVNNTKYNYLITDAVLPDNFHLGILLEQYDQAGYDRIYTPINAPSKLSKICHQNWICLDLIQNKLVRFEPNEEMEEFDIDNFCKTISTIKNVKYVGPEKDGIYTNPFDGCRLMSTILASFHLMNLSFCMQDLSDKDLLQFACLAQNEIKSFTPLVTFSKRITRSKKH